MNFKRDFFCSPENSRNCKFRFPQGVRVYVGRRIPGRVQPLCVEREFRKGTGISDSSRIGIRSSASLLSGVL
jgi:hypothetical protein